jgi:hypothetical protein
LIYPITFPTIINADEGKKKTILFIVVTAVVGALFDQESVKTKK